MDDRDIPGEQVGQLCQKHGRPQIAHQTFIKKCSRVVSSLHVGQDCFINGNIALASAGCDDHIHTREDLRISLDPRGVECHSSGIRANALL
jgi:hypothetical protein